MMLIDGGGGGKPTLYTYADINNAWSLVNTRQQNAWAADHKEATDAIAAARADDSCNYADDFESKMAKFKTEYDASVTAARALVNGPFLEHSGVAKHLQGMVEDWKKVGTKIGGVEKVLGDHQQMEEWQSGGAAVYKDALPTQAKALQELQGVAQSQSRAVDVLSLMNAYMFSQARSGLQYISGKISTTGARPVTKGGKVGGYINGTWIFDYHFFWRSYDTKAYLDSFVEWGKKQQNVSTADWADSANDLSKRLEKVETMPNNLGTNGVWPEGKAQHTPEAADTGSPFYTSTYVSGVGSTDTDGGGIGLDRRGVG